MMGDFSAGAAITSGFRLVAREPLSFLAWTLVILVLIGGPYAFMLTRMGPFFNEAFRISASGPNPDVGALLAAEGPIFQADAVLMLGLICTHALVTTAIFRAMLDPGDRSYFYLRLGAREAWVGLVALVLFVLYIVGCIAGSIPVGILAGIAAATRAPGAGLIMFLGVALVIGGVIWALLRLSLALPMAYARRTFMLMESWPMTKGHAWKMFGVALAMLLLFIGLELVLGAVTLTIIFSGVSAPDLREAVSAEGPLALWRHVNPLGLAVGGLLWLGLVSLYYVMFGAAWAEMYKGLGGTAADAF